MQINSHNIINLTRKLIKIVSEIYTELYVLRSNIYIKIIINLHYTFKQVLSAMRWYILYLFFISFKLICTSEGRRGALPPRARPAAAPPGAGGCFPRPMLPSLYQHRALGSPFFLSPFVTNAKLFILNPFLQNTLATYYTALKVNDSRLVFKINIRNNYYFHFKYSSYIRRYVFFLN